MTDITIDNQTYDFESLSDEAKAQIISIQFVQPLIFESRAATPTSQSRRPANRQIRLCQSTERDLERCLSYWHIALPIKPF